MSGSSSIITSVDRAHRAPYVLNDDGLLTPWLLGAGRHTLRVVVGTSSGGRTSLTVHVTTQAALSPAELVGDFPRTVTRADLERTASQDPGLDASELPPLGTWTLNISRTGLIRNRRPAGKRHQRVGQHQRRGSLVMWGPANWLEPHDRQGHFCEPEPSGTYHWSGTSTTLTVTGGSECADR